ncbi:MAG: hypothetical protein HY860_00055 [Chlamydiales bacterium]|nr:hypothetical protein [Chlamydiales bacterium]
MISVLSIHYDGLVRDNIKSVMRRTENVTDMPYYIEALEQIALTGAEANLTLAGGRDVSAAFAPVIELFTDYEMYGIDDEQKIVFFTLIRKISGEVANFFKSKSDSELHEIVLSERVEIVRAREGHRVLAAAREELEPIEIIPIVESDAIILGRLSLLMTIEYDGRLRWQFEKDCEDFYCKMPSVEDGIEIYSAVMLQPQPFCFLLFRNIRMKDIFNLRFDKISSIIRHPEGLEKLITSGMSFYDLRRMSNDKWDYMLGHVDAIVTTELTHAEVNRLHVEQLRCIVDHCDAYKTILAMPEIDRNNLLSQHSERLLLLLTHVRALKALLTAGVTFAQLTKPNHTQLAIFLNSYGAVIFLIDHYGISLDRFRYCKKDQLEMILSFPSCYKHIQRLPIRVIEGMTVEQLEIQLCRPSSREAIKIR